MTYSVMKDQISNFEIFENYLIGILYIYLLKPPHGKTFNDRIYLT